MDLQVLTSVACVVVAVSSLWSGTSTWSPTKAVDAQWSISTDWTPGVPADGDDVVLAPAEGAVCTLRLDKDVSIHSLTQNQMKTENKELALDSVKGKAYTLSLGAGGYTVVPCEAWSETGRGRAVTFYTPVQLLASQTWSLDMPSKFGNFAEMRGSLSGSADVLWKICGRYRMSFISGSSGDFLGKVEANTFMRFMGVGQASRLGTAGATITSGLVDGVPGYPGLFFESSTGADIVCETPLTLYATNAPAVASSSYSPFCLDVVAVDPAARTTLRFTHPLKGLVGDQLLLFSGYRPHSHNSYEAVGATSIHRRDMVRLILDQDNSELMPLTPGAQIYLSMCLNLAHPDALGKDNGAFDLLMYPEDLAYTKGHSGILGVFASNGVSVAANLLTPQISATVLTCRYDRFVVGTDGPGTSVFSGELKTLGTTFARSPGFRFMPDKGGAVRVTGKITDNGPFEVVGRGDTILANATNAIPNDPVRIRGGRLILGAEGALGMAPVLLGDVVPNRVTVKAMCVGRIANSYETGVVTRSSEGEGLVNNVMEFGTVAFPAKTFVKEIDGVTIDVGDRVLLNSPYTSTYCHNPTFLPNGIWERIADADSGNVRWKRVDWLDDVAEFKAAYGLRVDIEEGDTFAGQSLFFANREDEASVNFNFTDDRLGFHEETEPQPSCALLTEVPMTVANAITVTDNRSTGASTIGTLAAGKTVFSNPVVLERDVVVTAPAGGTVVFDGGFTGSGTVTFDGEGAFDVVTRPNDPVRYKVKRGTVTYRYQPEAHALFHIDPTVTNSLTMEEGTYQSETVTNVYNWADVRGLADGRAQAVSRTPNPNAKDGAADLGIMRYPAYRLSETAPGWTMPVIDMQDLFVRNSNQAVTNAAAMDFKWANGSEVASSDEGRDSVFKHVLQAYVIAKDNVAYQAEQGMSFLGTTTSRNKEHYMRGDNGKMIRKPGSNPVTENVIGGETELDGVRVADVTKAVYPAGYHLICFMPTGNTWVASLGTYGNYRRGGITYGEVILFTNKLDEAEHRLLTRKLMNKWFNAGIVCGALTNEVSALGLSGGTTAYEGITAVRTAALATEGPANLEGDLILDENATIDVAFTDATHCGCVTGSGELTLPVSATVRVHMPAGAKTPAGAYRILAADSIVGDVSGWTVTSEGKYPMRVFRNGEGVWVSPVIPGVLIMVR